MPLIYLSSIVIPTSTKQ